LFRWYHWAVFFAACFLCGCGASALFYLSPPLRIKPRWFSKSSAQ
jgi:hypothetical protein